MGIAPAFASVSEATDMARAALGYLAAADATALAAAEQAECLQALEQAMAISTAAHASFLSAFTVGQGYSADADYSPRAWLIHQTRISKGAAVAHAAWARRATTHPEVVAALASGELSESYGRTICQWTEKLPQDCRPAADAILLSAARPGWTCGTWPGWPRRCTSGPAPMRSPTGPSRTARSGWRPRSAARGDVR